MVVIVNPFAGCEVGWSWAEHVAAGYQGGTDYIMYPPNPITAAADGTVTLASGQNGFTPGRAIILKLADGRTINYREVATILVKSGTKVTRAQAIGMPNRASRWPHIDATVDGMRVPFEPLVTGLSTAGGGSTPITPEKKDENMNGLKYLAHQKNGSADIIGWALVGVQFPNGALLTSDVNVAKGWAPISDNGGDTVTDDRWAPMLAAAKIASDDWKAVFASGGSGGLTSEQAAQLAAIPNTDELGQALTSTVTLVNEHTDTVVGGTNTASPAAITVTGHIATVPGDITLTGTSTPQ
jgi:hypothetical protein